MEGPDWKVCCKMDLLSLPILSPCKMKKPLPQGAAHALELQIVALCTSSRSRQSFPSFRTRGPWAGVVRAVLTELLECSHLLGSLIVICRWWGQKQGEGWLLGCSGLVGPLWNEVYRHACWLHPGHFSSYDFHGHGPDGSVGFLGVYPGC